MPIVYYKDYIVWQYLVSFMKETECWIHPNISLGNVIGLIIMAQLCSNLVVDIGSQESIIAS